MVFRLPVAQFPEIAPPQIETTAMYTGADALTVEQSVATPIDAQVNGAKRMIYMQAISGNDGTMTLQVSFETGTDIDIDQVQVQNRLAQAQANLPTAVNDYGLTTIQTAGIPLLLFTINSPNKTWDQNFLSNYVVINIKDELARVPGIGQVKIFGAANYAMRVWVAPDTIAKLGLTVTDLVNAITAQNVVNPAGTLGGEPAPPGRQLTYTVRARGRLMNAEEFGDVIVRANPDGSFVRLKDVARLELGAENYTQQAYGNGVPATIVGLYQVPGSNALDAANRAKATMARLAEKFPSDMNVALTLDTTVPVTEGAKEIVITLLEAIALVILVVFVFLQNWRATLIPILTIPVSLVGTFVFFPMMGFSTNTLSLLGLVLAVGLVVDDAIVVVEAIEAKIEQGLSPRDAALQAMDEVSGALVGIALVLSSVFIPAAFIAGITGSLYRQFALTIAFSVLISAFNALTLSPALGALILRPRPEGARRGLLGRFFAGFDRGFTAAQTGYVRACGFLIRKVRRRARRARRLHGARGRSREDHADVLHAAGGPGLLLHERAAPGGRVDAADERGHAEDRRDPEGRARRALRQRGVRVQPPVADGEPAQRRLLRPARPVRRAGDARAPGGRDRRLREPEALRAARRAGLRVPAARHPRRRPGRRRRRVHPGSRRQDRRLPLAEHAAVHGRAARSDPRSRSWRRRTRPPCRSSSRTSTRIGCSSSASRSRTCTRRSRRSSAAPT